MTLIRASAKCVHVFQGAFLALFTRNLSKEIGRREEKRGRHELRWFTPDEAYVAEALANVIVPSDEETPGLEDVCVLGPPAVVALDDLVATSPDRQNLYARGLLAFDVWAQKVCNCKFAEMPRENQIRLFRAAQQLYDDWTGGAPVMTKAWRRLRMLAQAGNGSLFAAHLYPQIRNDCIQVFYTSRVSWVWLEYDGPPMDKGYPNVLEPREN
jgi:Gluconate 2-dehydrogenase subunit 3